MTALLRRRGVERPPASTFSPADITGLRAWWKADALSLNDGDAVATWTDSSGNSKDGTQATAGKRPTYKTGIINGRPVVRFDGGDALVTPTIDLSAVDDITVFAVLSASSGTDQIVLEMSADMNAQADSFLMYRSAADKVHFSYRSLPSNQYSEFSTTATLTTTPRVVVALADKALATDEVTVWVDGATAGTRPQNANNSGNFGNRACYIGARNQASVFLTGDIAEMGIYSQALGTSDRDNLETYLGAKYGITVA